MLVCELCRTEFEAPLERWSFAHADNVFCSQRCFEAYFYREGIREGRVVLVEREAKALERIWEARGRTLEIEKELRKLDEKLMEQHPLARLE